MTVREHLNFAYHMLVDGKDEAGRADIDLMLAPPELKEKYQAQKDRGAQQKLQQSMMSFGLMPPPPPRKADG